MRKLFYYTCGTCGRLYGGTADERGSAEDALHCCAKPPVRVDPSRVVPCEACHGSGVGDALFAECGTCGGVGSTMVDEAGA